MSTRLIIFLGNPGVEYANTRHNLGWWVGELLAEKFREGFTRGDGDYEVAIGRIAAKPAHLLKPTTYMNNSGEAVDAYLQSNQMNAKDLIVVADDIDLPLGQIRIRTKGSSAGHNGVASIIEHIGTERFVRIRCGVGPVPEGVDPAEFVLDPFRADELIVARKMATTAAEAVKMILARGAVAAANVYNRKPPAPGTSAREKPGAKGPGEGE